jgi:PIN domain nuclease of toxin-antitoxin system
MARLADTVFDASALICLVRMERGWEKVAALGLNGLMSAVNLVEVAYRLNKHGMPLEAIDPAVRPLVGRIVPFDDQQAYLAAVIHGQTRGDGLSLADCACLALGLSQKATVVTADKEWKKLKLDVKIVQIR